MIFLNLILFGICCCIFHYIPLIINKNVICPLNLTNTPYHSNYLKFLFETKDTPSIYITWYLTSNKTNNYYDHLKIYKAEHLFNSYQVSHEHVVIYYLSTDDIGRLLYSKTFSNHVIVFSNYMPQKNNYIIYRLIIGNGYYQFDDNNIKINYNIFRNQINLFLRLK